MHTCLRKLCNLPLLLNSGCIALGLAGFVALMPTSALDEPDIRYHPRYYTSYSSSQETIEKLEILLEELEMGEHDAAIKTAEKAYTAVRKAEHQCASYHKAMERVNNSSVEGQKKKKSGNEHSSSSSSSYYSSSSYKKEKKEPEKRYEECLKKFRKQAADFRKAIAPVMVQLHVSETTWLGTWGIEYFCSYGTFGKYTTLFNSEDNTLKEALISCVKRHLETTKSKQRKSSFL